MFHLPPLRRALLSCSLCMAALLPMYTQAQDAPPSESLELTLGTVFEIAANSQLPDPVYSWVLTQDE